jgi:hypothetical protein
MRDSNPDESMEAEGLPELEDRPPGIDAELDSEGIMVPRDHPIAVGDDPAYPTTPAEERVVEGVAERAARENPDFGADELGVGGGVQGAARSRGDGYGAGDGSLSAEEAAVRVRSDIDGI